MDKLRAIFDQIHTDFERHQDESDRRHAELMAALYALHDNLDPRRRLEAEQRKLEAAQQRKLEAEQRKLEAEQRKLERAERWRKLDAKWKADDELFFITYGVTCAEAMAIVTKSSTQVIPNPPTAVVHTEVDILIVDSATTEFIEVPNALTNDVVPVATIDSPLPVPDHADEIADVKVDIGVDPIPMPVDLLAESIVVQPGTELMQSDGSTVHSAILVADLKGLQAPHVYVDPYLLHFRPLDFVIADFSTRAIPCFYDVVIQSFSVVEWTYGSSIFVFDPG